MGCVLELRNRLDWKHITSWARCFWCGLASEAWTYTDCFSWTFTAWDVSLFGVFLVCIFLHLDWIRRFIVDMEIYSVNLSIPPVDTCRSLSIRPENIRESYAFWCFLRIQKWNIHCVKYNRIRVFSNPYFTFTGKYGSEKTPFLVCLTQWYARYGLTRHSQSYYHEKV